MVLQVPPANRAHQVPTGPPEQWASWALLGQMDRLDALEYLGLQVWMVGTDILWVVTMLVCAAMGTAIANAKSSGVIAVIVPEESPGSVCAPWQVKADHPDSVIISKTSYHPNCYRLFSSSMYDPPLWSHT